MRGRCRGCLGCPAPSTAGFHDDGSRVAADDGEGVALLAARLGMATVERTEWAEKWAEEWGDHSVSRS